MRKRPQFIPPTDARQALAAAGLEGEDALLRADVGEVVKAAVEGHEVRRIGDLYVKRVTGNHKEIDNDLEEKYDREEKGHVEKSVHFPVLRAVSL